MLLLSAVVSGRAGDQRGFSHADGPGRADSQTLAAADAVLVVDPDESRVRRTLRGIGSLDHAVLVDVEMRHLVDAFSG